MIVDEKIQTKKKNSNSKVWYGNPQIELTEGILSYSRIHYQVNKTREKDYNDNELESIKQYIWETNIKNNLITTSDLCCINVPNKISINEFMSSISIYLSYISVIRVLKSPIPNYFFIYLQMKNKEYANIFYNTFNYSKINPIEKDYYIFAEVKDIKFEEVYRNELSYQNSKKFHGIKALVSPSSKAGSRSKTFFDDFEVGVNKISSGNLIEEMVCTGINLSSSELNSSISQASEEQNVCSICLEHIDTKRGELANPNYLGIIYVLCGHVFHVECSLKLDDDKCPLCRFTLSPANISTCSLCTCEDDLWMCLVCGTVNCGEEGNSNNHRKEHYLHTGHIYSKGLGDSHNITFDFTKNAPLHIWFQNSLTSHSQSESGEFFKEPKEKVEFIMSEYNSIISSQLDSQRLYYINLMRKIDESCHEEENKIDEDIDKLTKELKYCEKDLIESNESKTSYLDMVKNKETEVKAIEKELELTEKEYSELINRKNKFDEYKASIEQENKNKLVALEDEIEEIQNQIKDLKLHIKTLDKIGTKSAKNDGIAGASIEFMVSGEEKNKKRKNKK